MSFIILMLLLKLNIKKNYYYYKKIKYSTASYICLKIIIFNKLLNQFIYVCIYIKTKSSKI